MHYFRQNSKVLPLDIWSKYVILGAFEWHTNDIFKLIFGAFEWHANDTFLIIFHYKTNVFLVSSVSLHANDTFKPGSALCWGPFSLIFRVSRNRLSPSTSTRVAARADFDKSCWKTLPTTVAGYEYVTWNEIGIRGGTVMWNRNRNH